MKSIKSGRQEIDKIDHEISKLLKKRMAKVLKIKELKKKRGLPKTDQDRENEILEKLDSNYEKAIFKEIIKQSRKLQDDHLN
ncbi:MAG: chorismate mutase [bacterium]|nr:chorismate mutase [bacterium]